LVILPDHHLRLQPRFGCWPQREYHRALPAMRRRFGEEAAPGDTRLTLQPLLDQRFKDSTNSCQR